LFGRWAALAMAAFAAATQPLPTPLPAQPPPPPALRRHRLPGGLASATVCRPSQCWLQSPPAALLPQRRWRRRRATVATASARRAAAAGAEELRLGAPEEGGEQSSATNSWAARYYTACSALVASLFVLCLAAPGHLGPEALAPLWRSLAGSCGPVLGSAVFLRGAAQEGGLSGQTARRLHVAVVLALACSGLVLAAVASSALRSAVVASLGAGSLLFAMGAFAGAKLYLPFDVPTALQNWLLPRGGMLGRLGAGRVMEGCDLKTDVHQASRLCSAWWCWRYSGTPFWAWQVPLRSEASPRPTYGYRGC